MGSCDVHDLLYMLQMRQRADISLHRLVKGD